MKETENKCGDFSQSLSNPQTFLHKTSHGLGLLKSSRGRQSLGVTCPSSAGSKSVQVIVVCLHRTYIFNNEKNVCVKYIY